jgi:hypothetical protein
MHGRTYASLNWRQREGAHNALGEAVSLLIGEMMVISAAHSERRQDLEKRVLRLEGRQPVLASGPRLVSDGAGLRAGRAS